MKQFTGIPFSHGGGGGELTDEEEAGGQPMHSLAASGPFPIHNARRERPTTLALLPNASSTKCWLARRFLQNFFSRDMGQGGRLEKYPCRFPLYGSRLFLGLRSGIFIK